MLRNEDTGHTHALFEAISISQGLKSWLEVTYSAHTHRSHGDSLILSTQLRQSSDGLACTSGAERVTKSTLKH